MLNSSEQLFGKMSRYIYGTTRLGHRDVPMPQRLEVAQAAAESGLWFHTGRQYGEALETLGEAFGRKPQKMPPMVFKIGSDSIEEVRASIRNNLEPLGLDSMEVGQLCLGGEYALSFRDGGRRHEELVQLKEEGLVTHFICELFPWTSDSAEGAPAAGHAERLVEAFIFYLNPLQRFASNALWDLAREKRFPVIGMRTVCGAPVHALRDRPGSAWRPYLQQRAAEVAPVVERSGINDWIEFCVRFSFSFPFVKATVGSTSRVDHLQMLADAASSEVVEPLPEATLEALSALHRRWPEKVDANAEPWTM